MSEQHSFIFPIAAIKQLVEQRTSTIGKMRGSETEPHLLDRLSLTDGESFLTDEWLEEAAAETYDWIKAFGRNVGNAFRIYPDGELHTIVENWGAHLETAGQVRGLSYKQDLSSSNFSSVRNNAQSDAASNIAAFTVNVNLPAAVDIALGGAAEVYYTMVVNYTTGINGVPIEDKAQHTINSVVSVDTEESGCRFVVKLTTLLGDMVVKSVDSVEITITKATARHFTLQKGDYIVWQGVDGSERYGIVGVNYDSNSEGPIIAEMINADVRNSIVMKVELPDWQDRNMLPMIERNLKDALSYFIIWRWFEEVYPQEAQSFKDRWEEKAHQAQLGLNTENHTLQRDATWLK